MTISEKSIFLVFYSGYIKAIYYINKKAANNKYQQP
ncbi:hypothetical protein BHWA1_02600 [Brachyspira hyodysenteriae WA1]|uniref:Uncharacterized protein n=1 Tax=Brachyspira hyodysenteriae (strain ATCC 49526 / WA1) TaxID=565034 RepID=A0A3B6VFB2_BRAHW|nr:hypothetical protein BHWA1_02600 [Brachyspira hyodysenteriae WA1]